MPLNKQWTRLLVYVNPDNFEVQYNCWQKQNYQSVLTASVNFWRPLVEVCCQLSLRQVRSFVFVIWVSHVISIIGSRTFFEYQFSKCHSFWVILVIGVCVEFDLCQ